MSPADDALELLLPDASEAARERARSVVRCLRLVVDDAHASRAQTVGVDLTRARRELDRHGRAQIDQALRELLRQHLEAAVPADSCAWFGEPGAGWSSGTVDGKRSTVRPSAAKTCPDPWRSRSSPN